jgi:hypothetical protein
MATPSSGHGAVPLGPDDDTGRERPAWLIPLLAVVAALLVGLLLWLLLADDEDDDELAASPAPSVSETPSELPSATLDPSDIATSSPTAGLPTATATASPAGTAPAPDADADVALTAGTEEVFPLQSPDQDLSTFSGEVVGRSVPVESVPADEGFWLGTGPDQRVWVEIVAIEGETPYQVEPGDVVSFSGAEFVPHDASYADRIGVTDDEGASQLTAQRAHVQVRTSELGEG